MRCRIKVIKDVTTIFPECKPTVGKIYDAEYTPRHKQKYGDKYYSGNGEFCVVNISGKRIVLRSGEFETIGGVEDGN